MRTLRPRVYNEYNTNYDTPYTDEASSAADPELAEISDLCKSGNDIEILKVNLLN